MLTKKELSFVIPTGTASRNARTSSVGDTLTRDGYHLSYDLGRYVAGLTFVRMLAGASLGNCFAPDGIGGRLREIAAESALNAVKNPCSVTSSVFVGNRTDGK